MPETGTRPRPFLVLAARRSGTTFLLDALASHPEVRCEKRAFDVVPRWRLLTVEDPESRYRAFRAASVRRRVEGRVRPAASVEAYAASLCETHRGATRLGLRLSYEQARRWPRVLRWARARRVPVVHLVRANALKTLVSRATSQARRVHHTREPLEPVRVRIPPRALLRRLRRLTREVAAFRRTLEGSDHLEIVYEQLVGDPRDESQRLLSFLGVDPGVSLSSDYVKLNPDDLREVLSNHDEIRKALAGTPWAAWA